MSVGRAALANPDWPTWLAEGKPFEPFEPRMLSPLADLRTAATWRARS